MAERFGLATHVLRHWESVGLLTPHRVEGARRRYSPADLFRVAAILRAKEAGFSLDDIRDMTTAPDPATRRKILTQHRAKLAHRIAEARVSLDLIDCALECEHDDIATCPHFQAVLADKLGTGEASPLRT
ncbi:MerR family transcriptional regulator [Amycolatopsis sp. NPDC051071]|uniref:helix-turn-helix domain-containing protein n=1 Tax=Amycolatopsis sp. NPDC051071 TaxID=3154637 RepID=UPI003444FE9F